MNTHAPPKNANAPLAKGRRDKLTGARDYSGCQHSATVTEMMPLGSVHYAAERCAVCSAFVRWLPSPQSIQRRAMNVARVARLLTVKGLTNWETTFLANVSQQRKLSPRQENVLGRIYREYFRGASL